MKIVALLLLAWHLTAATAVVRVHLGAANGNRIVTLPLEAYVAATLAGESASFQSDEALKAMAVAARTYAIRMKARHAAEGFDLCDTTHCQRVDMHGVTPRLTKAAAETLGELLWYQGKTAFTPYTKDCGGTTEDAAAIWPDLAQPYLQSHADPYCTRAPATPWRWTANPRDIALALQRSLLRGPRLPERISIATKTPSGRAHTLTLGGGNEAVSISASSFRFAVGRELGWNTLRGDRYEIAASNGRITFEGTGEGHGVGLCQRGAEQMGSSGRTWREILAFYYPGTIPGLTGRGLSWQRLSGEAITLQTTRPDQDRVALATAERLAHGISDRVGWPLPSGIVLRVYPDLDTFRNATGEPGWVAAHTEGLVIDMQPTALLRSRNTLDSTILHELFHVAVESRAAPGLPLWFREGLADYLANPAPSREGTPRIPSDADLRQTADPARARRAYADAAAMVAHLVRSYGETTVLSWVGRGLPLEITKASSGQEMPKNK